jgi:hypothetical protein
MKKTLLAGMCALALSATTLSGTETEVQQRLRNRC